MSIQTIPTSRITEYIAQLERDIADFRHDEHLCIAAGYASEAKLDERSIHTLCDVIRDLRTILNAD